MSTSNPVVGSTAASLAPKATPEFSPGLEGVIAGKTSISHVNPERNSLMYRGYDIRDLAEHASFEEVAYLLLHGSLPTEFEYGVFQQQLLAARHLPFSVEALFGMFPPNANPMDLLKVGVAMLSLYDPQTQDNSPEANLKKSIRLTAQLSTLIAQSYRINRGQPVIEPDLSLSHGENFLYMLLGKKPDAYLAKIFDMSLICYAEHGFNASTFAGRVTVSTLSDIHSAVASAVGTLKGPLHGGANEEAMVMLQEIGSPEQAETWIRNALAQKKKIMGFGHRAYKTGDPRAVFLTEAGKALSEQLGDTRWYDIAAIVERVMVSEKKIFPNVDFPTAYVYYLMQLPIEIYTPIFALARITGWCANFMEQLDNNRLFRPKALYDGPAHLEYVPIQER